MKKKLLKIFAFIFCSGLCLTGCATVSDVKDNSGNNIYFDKPEYFQGQVAKVGDYLYFGNAYADITEDGFNYSSSASNAYLARVNLKSLSFDEDVLEDNYSHSSPEGIEKVNGDKLVGYVNQQMYAYGDYLYFTSANIHKTDTMLNDYERVSLFRIKFNGDGLQELGTFTYDENSTITLQQGSDEEYYLVIVCPTEVEEDEEASTYDIYSIKVGNSVGKATKLVGEVNSAVVADEKSSQRNVIYSYGTESERLPNAVSSVDYATTIVTEHDGGNSKTISFVGREGDIVFYSYADEIYYKDINTVSTFNPSINNLFYSASNISNVEKTGSGYVFVGTSSLMYKASLTSTAQKLASTSDYSDILFVDGDYVYLSNDSSIMKVSVFGGEIEKIVKDMTIISGECGYAEGYIYFYATRGELVDENGDALEAEEDSTYYLYQTDKEGNIQLLGQVK